MGASVTVLRFATIDLAAHASICVAFRRDSFVCSFGSDERFVANAGPDGAGYVERLRQHIADFPDGYVHVWQGGAIIGQLEMRIKDEPRHHGYVNLFYLVEAQRAAGHGDALHDYALAFMCKHGVDSMQLSVSPTNARALAYYRKHAWRDLGLRPGRDDVHLLERDVS